MKKVLLAVISFYQTRISPLLPATCRYYPTCSQYAKGALEEHGWLKGSAMAFFRLMRCNIFFPGGYDPVPPAKTKKDNQNTEDAQ
ncbi:MAG: membrane protein insertion efficiency factor YidD [Clostridiales bacterium]|nr:membrane protein insertion efficiency factor YidD [Clostridiales bacterium]